LFKTKYQVNKKINIFGENNMIMREILILLVGIMFVSSPMQAMDIDPDPKTVTEQDTTASMPKVFVLGYNESAYDQLSVEYSASLIEVNAEDAAQAQKMWTTMIVEMEAYADMLEFDIKGVKMWMHVFWNEKGEIKHIGFYLKQSSRNIDTNELTSFLMDFMNNYYVPRDFEKKFSHISGSGVAFPTMNWQIKKRMASKGK